MSYIDSYKMLGIIGKNRSAASGSGKEVIQMRAAAFASAGVAADMLDASLDHLAATDWTALGTSAHAEMLVRLSRARRSSLR